MTPLPQLLLLVALALCLGFVVSNLFRRGSCDEQILHYLRKIMATQAELAQALTDLGTQLDKASGEIVAAVKALEDALAAAGGTTPAVDAALLVLKGKVQAMDDLNPDTP